MEKFLREDFIEEYIPVLLEENEQLSVREDHQSD